MDNPISMEETAKKLGVSYWTICRWTRLKLIPSYRIGKRRLYDPKEIDAFIQRRKISPVKSEITDPKNDAKFTQITTATDGNGLVKLCALDEEGNIWERNETEWLLLNLKRKVKNEKI